MSVTNEEIKLFIENELTEAVNKAVEKAMTEWIERMLYGPENSEAVFRNDISSIHHVSYGKDYIADRRRINGNTHPHDERGSE